MAKNPLDVSGIYVILHVDSGRAYVGSAVRIRTRWNHHLHLLRTGKHYSRHLQNAWTKYGSQAFRFEIVEHVADKTLLLKREQFWIDWHNAADHEIGFNSVAKAGSQIGYRHTYATRLKLSLSHKGKGMTPEAVEKMRRSLTGKSKSPEHVAKVAAALVGKKASAATREKMSRNRTGWDRLPTGMRETPEFRAKFLAAIKARDERLKEKRSHSIRSPAVHSTATVSATIV